MRPVVIDGLKEDTSYRITVEWYCDASMTVVTLPLPSAEQKRAMMAWLEENHPSVVIVMRDEAHTRKVRALITAMRQGAMAVSNVVDAPFYPDPVVDVYFREESAAVAFKLLFG